MPMLTPATAEGVMAMFEEIRLASSVNAAAGSRKVYLAKLFATLLRISAGRSTAVETASGNEMNLDPSGPSKTDIASNIAQWQEHGFSVDSNASLNAQADALFSTSLDGFASL